MTKLIALAVALAFATAVTAQDKAEAEFLKTGPKLYTMAQAEKVAAETGKPIACWVGPHLFANPEARALSASLGATTIQAAMDSKGGDSTPRLVISNNGYKDAAKTYFIPLARLSEPGMAERVLSIARGGKE